MLARLSVRDAKRALGHVFLSTTSKPEASRALLSSGARWLSKADSSSTSVRTFSSEVKNPLEEGMGPEAMPTARRTLSHEMKGAIDRRGLLKQGKSPFASPPTTSTTKSPETELCEQLREQIHLRGPLSMAEWMQICLGHPQFGYYMQREAIGKEGDFVTSPELVSIFGELIGVWCVSTWVKLGRPPKIQLIELGPGRGTLMKDILSAAERFPDFRKAISVHMVENSGRMRELQRETLCVTMNDNTAANMSKLKADGEINVDFAKDPTKVMVQQYVDGVSNITFPSDKPSGGEGEAVNPHAAPADLFAKDVEKNAPPPPLSVHWHWTIKDVPVGVPCIIVGNEFLDALPVHQFQFTERGWREILIDIDNGPGPHHFKYVLAPEPTPASRSFVSPVNPLEGLVSPVKPSTPGASSSSSSSPSSTGSKILTSDTVAPLHGTASSPISGGRIAPIPSLVVMEDGKPREVKLEHVKPAPTPLEQAAAGLGPQIGDTYEVSPACFVWTEQIALRIMKTGGAALLIDYGDNDAGFEFAEPNSPSSPAAGASLPAFSDKVKRPLSVMGLKKHGHADVLSEPGLVDLSAHVNFGALRAVARRVSNQISLLLQQPPGSKDHRRALEVMNIIAKRSPSTPAGVEVKPRAFHKIDVYPAITQSQLLQQLGIEARYERLMRNVKSEADAKALHAAVNRLVDPSQMGTLFKAMALVQGGMAPPAGWSKAEGEQQE